jgi:hypothetical protein
MTTARQWLVAYAEALGTDAPDQAQVDELLALAGVAAHAAERVAAPLSTWLAAKAGVDPTEARRLATELSARLSAAESGGGGDVGG